MPDEINYYGLVNKPSIDEIRNLDLVNKPDISSDELAHYGILKMKWGVRRYQNPDGTLTELGKQRLRERRYKFEIKEAKRQEKAEKREARAKARREKKLANPDPKWLSKNMHKFTNEEINRAIDRIKMKKTMEDIQKERIDIGKHKADTIIGYGQTLNNALKFINSDMGKGIRQKLGMGTETLFNFSGEEKKKEENERRAQEWEKYKKEDAYKRALNMKEWKEKDDWKRQHDLEYEMRKEQRLYEIMGPDAYLEMKKNNKGSKDKSKKKFKKYYPKKK